MVEHDEEYEKIRKATRDGVRDANNDGCGCGCGCLLLLLLILGFGGFFGILI